MSALSIAAVEALNAKPIDVWDAWLFAEAEASLALATWTRAPDGEKASAYATYVAALDREEQAGRVLALCVGAQPAATKKPATMWPAKYIWTYSCQSEQEREHPEGDDKTLPALQDPGNVDPPRSEKCQRARFAAS